MEKFRRILLLHHKRVGSCLRVYMGIANLGEESLIKLKGPHTLDFVEGDE